VQQQRLICRHRVQDAVTIAVEAFLAASQKKLVTLLPGDSL
jgi:hypothetical protein